MAGNQLPEGVKPHWQMTKLECLTEVAQTTNAVNLANLTLPELRVLVKEGRIKMGVIKTAGPVDGFMDRVKKAKMAELQELCHSRGIPIVMNGKDKTTVGEMRLALRSWVVNNGNAETVVDFGEHQGMTFQELLTMHPKYVQWAQKETRSGESGWQLRQLAAWANRMENNEEEQPTSRLNLGYVDQYKKSTSVDAVMPSAADQDSKMKDMMTKMEEMQEELNELKGRGRKKTSVSGQTDGSFEAVMS